MTTSSMAVALPEVAPFSTPLLDSEVQHETIGANLEEAVVRVLPH